MVWNNKLVLGLLLQDNPGELEPNQLAILVLRWPRRYGTAHPSTPCRVFKSTGWHASRNYYTNSTLKMSRWTVMSGDFMLDALPIATPPINLGLAPAPTYTSYIAWLTQWITVRISRQCINKITRNSSHMAHCNIIWILSRAWHNSVCLSVTFRYCIKMA